MLVSTPPEQARKINELERRLEKFHLDWDRLNIYTVDKELDWTEQEKLRFPKNLLIYPQLADICLVAIADVRKDYEEVE